MSNKVLCVDDEPRVVDGYRRALHQKFRIDAAYSGEEALEAIAKQGPYAVILTDLRMPGMDGVQLLSRVRASAPDTVRIMMTGFADVAAAMNAVNEGHVFRFLAKPCATETLERLLADGIRQYELVTSERVLLSRTLCGAVKVLTEVLSLANPTAFSQGTRVRPLVRKLCRQMGVASSWTYEIAAMLSQVGCLTLPPGTVEKAYHSERLSPDEQAMLDGHPAVGARLVAHIPRLEEVACFIEQQQRRYLGGDGTNDGTAARSIPLGARILKVALDFDRLSRSGLVDHKALLELRARAGWYDPDVLNALEEVIGAAEVYEPAEVAVRDLTSRMILAEDIVTTYGTLLVTKGQEVTLCMKQRLANFAKQSSLKESVKVLIRRPGAADSDGIEDDFPEESTR